MLEIRNLKKSYGDISPLRDVCAKINKGDIIAIIGPSGTGKSTLLRCINRLEEPTSGVIVFNDVNILDEKCNICKVRQKIGMVFQTFNLFDNLTIVQNIMSAPMNILKMPKDEAYNMALALLDKVGLKDKKDSYPYELSGGQKQRVAIMRSIAMNPDILLFDEPTSALDPAMIEEVIGVIKGLVNKGITMLIVTHEMNFAKNIANRVFYMDEGIIYEEGTPDEIFDHPKKEKTKIFISKINSMNYKIKKDEYNLYDLVKEILLYLERRKYSIKVLKILTLLIEELVENEIIANANDFDVIDMTLNISNDDKLFIGFDKLSVDFDYKFTSVNEISDKIIKKYLTNKVVLKNECKVAYEFKME